MKLINTVDCDICKKTLTGGELSNKVLKDIGLESGGVCVRVEKFLCDECYEEFFKDG